MDAVEKTIAEIAKWPHFKERDGCCLHIALGDGNLETSNIEFCLEQAVDLQHGHCALVGIMLYELDYDEREEVYVSW